MTSFTNAPFTFLHLFSEHFNFRKVTIKVPSVYWYTRPSVPTYKAAILKRRMHKKIVSSGDLKYVRFQILNGQKRSICEWVQILNGIPNHLKSRLMAAILLKTIWILDKKSEYWTPKNLFHLNTVLPNCTVLGWSVTINCHLTRLTV